MTEFATFGKMLHYYRTQVMRLSQRELAARAGCSRTTICNIERDQSQSEKGLPIRPAVETIDAICNAVGADPVTARLMVYPPDNHGSSVIIAGEHAHLPETSSGVDIRKTIADLRSQASAYRQIADKLSRTADELQEFGP